MADRNPFDQFDEPVATLERNPFDQFDPTPGERFDAQTRRELDVLNNNAGEKEFMFVPGRNVNVELPKGGIERTWNLMQRSFGSGKKNVELAELGAGIIFGDISPETEDRITKLQRSLAAPDPRVGILPPPKGGWVNYIAEAIAEQGPNIIGMIHDGIETGAATGITAMGATALAGPAAPVLAPFVPVLTAAGFTAGSVNFAFNQIAGGSYLEYRDFTDEQGNKLPDDLAKLGAVMSGMVGAGLEVLPFGLLAKMMPGVSKIFQKAGVKVNEALKFPTTTQAMKTFLFNIASVAAAEGVTESLQEVVQIETGEALKVFTEGDFEPVDTTEMLARIKEAGLKGAIVGGGIAIPVAGARAAVDVTAEGREARQLERGVEAAREEEVREGVAPVTPEVVTPETVVKVVEEIEEISTEVVEKPAPEGFSAEDLETDGGERIRRALEAIAPTQKTRETLIRGRIAVLDRDILAIDRQVSEIDQQIVDRKASKQPTKALETRSDKLLNQRAILDVERDNMLIMGLANNLKVSKKVSSLEQKRLKRKQEEDIDKEEARLILEELEQGNEPERIFRRDEEGFLEEVFQVRSTNPPFLFGDLDTVGLKQGGKKPNRRSKRAVINAVKRVFNGKPAPTDKPQAALHQRILDIIEDRLSGELNRFQPGTGTVDPFRGNSVQGLAELQAEEGITTIQELFTALKSPEVIAQAEIDVTKPIQIKGEKLVKLEEQSLKAQERALSKGFTQGARLAKKNLVQAIKNLKQLVRSTALPRASKDKIITRFSAKAFDFVKDLSKIKSDIAIEFERLSVRREKARLDKLLSAKALKPTVVSGVKQGKFDAAIQVQLNSLQDLNKVSTTVNPETGQSEASLLLEKRIELDSGIMDPLGNALLNFKANPRDVTSAELKFLADSIEALTAEGRAAGKARVLGRQIQAQNVANNSIEFVSAGENLRTWQRIGTGAGARNVKNWTKNLISQLIDGWDDVVERVLPGSQAQELGINRDLQREKGIKRRMNKRVTVAASKAFGIKEGRKLSNQLENRNQSVDHGVRYTNKRDDNGVIIQERLTMSRAEATKLFMENQDPTLRETITGETGNGFTQETLTYLFNDFLTEQDKAFGLEQLKIYEEFYNEINEVYTRVNGINLEKNEFYSPIRRQVDGQEFGLDEFGRDLNYRQNVKVATSGSLKARLGSIKPLLQQSDMEVYSRHINAMSRFIALREKTQLLNAIFMKKDVRDAYDIKYGKDFNKNIAEHLQSFVNGANNANGILSKMVNTLNRNFAAAQLGAKAKIGFTQLASYFAYAETISAVAFVNGSRDFFFNMPTAIRTLNQSELLKARGYSPDVEIARMGATFDSAWLNKIRNAKDNIIDYALIATKVGDRVPIYIGGWALYKQTLKETGSKVKAMEAFEDQTSSTQQSTDPDKLSLVQKGNPMFRAMTMFMSAPIAQLRGEIRAGRRLMKGEITFRQFAKSFLIYHFILPGLYQAIANGLVFGEWDKEDQIRAAILGSLNGLPLFGDLIEAAVREFMGLDRRRINTDVLKWAGPLKEFSGDLIDVFTTDGDFEEIVEAVLDAAKASGSLHGLPAPQAENIVKGFEDLSFGEPKAAVMRWLGWPNTVVSRVDE